MKSWITMAALSATLLGGAIAVSAPASAQVHIGIGVPGVHVGVGVGAPAFYGPGFYPPGPCDAYTSYYDGDCGYSVYNGPIMLGGVNVGGPHYYRWYNDQPYFWYRGGWQVWNGWRRSNFAWNRGEGFGWRNGRWDRGWGDAHWHGRPADFRGGPDRGRDFHGGPRNDFHGRDDHRDDRGRGDDRHDDHGGHDDHHH